MNPRTQCDGTTRNGIRNCETRAAWKIKRHGDPEYVYAACGSHLSQVGVMMLEGETGELDIRRIVIDER